MSDDAIRFQAQTYGVRTLTDGGVRLTLDLIGTTPELFAALFSTKQPGVLLEVAAVAIDTSKTNYTDLDDETTEEAKGSADKLDSGRRSIRRNKNTGGGV